MRQTLLELAERCEKANADQQEALLREAFQAIHSLKPYKHPDAAAWVAWLDLFNPFRAMLEAKAFESAALTLVPEGHTTAVVQDHSAWLAEVRALGVSTHIDWPNFKRSQRCATPALALGAAALRSRAAQVKP